MQDDYKFIMIGAKKHLANAASEATRFTQSILAFRPLLLLLLLQQLLLLLERQKDTRVKFLQQVGGGVMVIVLHVEPKIYLPAGRVRGIYGETSGRILAALGGGFTVPLGQATGAGGEAAPK
jgi:hypothetical protein